MKLHHGNPPGSGEFTTAPLHVPTVPSGAHTIEPETIRLPPAGLRCPYSGMARSALNALILPTEENDGNPPVRSYVLRRKGARTGIRLIDWKSLKSFIHQHAEAGGKEVA